MKVFKFVYQLFKKESYLRKGKKWYIKEKKHTLSKKIIKIGLIKFCKITILLFMKFYIIRLFKTIIIIG